MKSRQTAALVFAGALAGIPGMATAQQEVFISAAPDVVPYVARTPRNCRAIGDSGFRCTLPPRYSPEFMFHNRATRRVCTIFVENRGTSAQPRYVIVYESLGHKCSYSWRNPTEVQVRW